MNWRIIIGVILLLVGMMELYTVMANAALVRQKMSPAYIEIGCIVWMGVGVMLVVTGMRKKGDGI